MDDFFMRFGMIVVGIVVILVIMIFAFSALNNSSLIPEDYSQKVKGDSYKVEQRISRLCSICTSENVQKDCFLLEVDLEHGEVRNNLKETRLHQNLTPGQYTLKLSSNRSICEVREVG